MRGKKIAILFSSAALLISGWMPAAATFTLAGSAAMIAGCSPERSDTRQDARTSTRTEDRVEERRD